MTANSSYDFAVVGGGVIGLSIAWQLASTGSRIAVVERGVVGREASWAGAGILPPRTMVNAHHPREQLAAISFELHADWARQLKEQTGIDTGFCRSGAIFIARTPGEVAALSGQVCEWQEDEIDASQLNRDQLIELAPALSPVKDSILSAAIVPDEFQIRNPRHLQALAAACRMAGVDILEGQGDTKIDSVENRVTGIVAESGNAIIANRYCFATGAWSGLQLEEPGVSISTLPVRGQILLFQLPQPAFTQIIYEGTRYIVPRDDGFVLVGSTLEEAGFDKSTTAEGIDGLLRFANGIFSELNANTLVKSWAGLRPATFDGFPYMGPVPGLDNAWVATGHFRSGLSLSTGTAEIMTQLLTGQKPAIDMAPFRLDRG